MSTTGLTNNSDNNTDDDQAIGWDTASALVSDGRARFQARFLEG
jgi:hypothetical protein